jgi:hypothetical protein
MKTRRGPAPWLSSVLCLLLPAAALAQTERAPVRIEVTPAHVEFRVEKTPVGRYNIDPQQAKPYFYPLLAPNRQPLTRAWPVEKNVPGESTDHVHQKGAWLTYGDVIPEGIELKQKIKGVEGVDFWSEAPGHGSIVCVKVGDVEQVRDHGSVVTFNEWRTADGVKIMDEKRTIHLYNLGDSALFVIESELTARVCPITFADTKEGAFGVRVRDSMTLKANKGGQLVNAEGKTGEGDKNNVNRDGCWGLKSAWCDYSGPVDGAVAGVALMADPKNPFPSYWHARGYGLLAANPFGRGKSGFPDARDNKDLVKLAKGEKLSLRFGMLLHAGDAKEGKVAEAYQEFVRLRK